MRLLDNTRVYRDVSALSMTGLHMSRDRRYSTSRDWIDVSQPISGEYDGIHVSHDRLGSTSRDRLTTNQC